MEVFGILGMSLGVMGFIFALSALTKVTALEKQLQQKGLLNEEAPST